MTTVSRPSLADFERFKNLCDQHLARVSPQLTFQPTCMEIVYDVTITKDDLRDARVDDAPPVYVEQIGRAHV